MKANPKLSKAGKMPCKSWSLPAFYSCPGSVNDNASYSGYLKDWNSFQDSMQKDDRVPTCSGCYAMTGNYCFNNVKSVREHNLEDWKNDRWVNAMRKLIKDDRYFRFFDSGDIYCVELAEKIYRLCKSLPDTTFWIPTLSWKIKEIDKVLTKIRMLPNVTVRHSTGTIRYTGEPAINLFPIGGNISSVVTPEFAATEKAKGKYKLVCQAYSRDGKCGDCRACWDRRIDTIFYPAHGMSLKSKVKQLEV